MMLDRAQIVVYSNYMNYEMLPHYWINHVGFLIRKQLVQEFRQNGHAITAEEWAVLLIIQAEDGISATALSNKATRDKTTISRLVDKMVAKGLIRRERNAADKRATLLYLTPPGHATFDKLAVLAKNLIARTTQGISAHDLERTISTLSRIAENIDPNPESEPSHGI